MRMRAVLRSVESRSQRFDFARQRIRTNSSRCRCTRSVTRAGRSHGSSFEAQSPRCQQTARLVGLSMVTVQMYGGAVYEFLSRTRDVPLLQRALHPGPAQTAARHQPAVTVDRRRRFPAGGRARQAVPSCEPR